MNQKPKSVSAARVFNARFTSTLSISLVLFLAGIMLTLGFLAGALSDHVKKNVCMSVVVDDEMELPDARMFQKKLEALPWARSVTYIDKETALKELVDALGDNPEDLLGYNPALASFEVYLNADYANTDSMAMAETYLKRFKNVQEVIYRKDLIHLVNENVKRINLILLVLAVLLTLISYSLIRNTVRLLIYSKRFLIRTMQLVGAGRGFIRKPFLIGNIWSGLIASVLAMGYLYALLLYLDSKVGGIINLLDPIMLGSIFLVVLLFGLVIMTSATWLAVNKYLRMNTNDLYYV
jgi:cell division transport system permease protein